MRELRLIHLTERGIRLASRRGVDALQYLPNRADGSILDRLSWLQRQTGSRKRSKEISKKVWRLHVGEEIPLERILSLCEQGIREAQQMAGGHML